MQNAALTEFEQSAIGAAWAAIGGRNRKKIEAQLLGSVIVGLYPVNSIRPTKNGPAEFQAGIAILYRQSGSPGIKTAIIENSEKPGSADDEISLMFYDGVISPE